MNTNEKNHILNSEEIRQKKLILESRPITLDTTLTTRCNLKCSMCGVVKKHWDLPDKAFDEIKQIIPYLSFTTWQGGEAFLYPRFKELLSEAHKYNITQTIYTNALLLDDEWMKELINGPKTFFVSMDSVSEKLYSNIRKGGKFPDLIKKFDLINKYKGISNYKLDTYMNVVIMRSNYEEIKRFIPFAAEHGVCKVEFSPVEGNIKNENIFRFPDNDILRYLEEIRPELQAQAEEYDIRLFNRLPYKDMLCDKDISENTSEELFCTLPWTFLFILAGGKVVPHGSCKKIVGDINKQSIMEIWNGLEMQE